jgi:hypothetical protein
MMSLFSFSEATFLTECVVRYTPGVLFTNTHGSSFARRFLLIIPIQSLYPFSPYYDFPRHLNLERL